ncbi:MAG: hypothetical protein IPI07_14410, partial [Flavobacteriales bacterium]|nr:hypothetical protein [Flavobacteriales bacterium]
SLCTRAVVPAGGAGVGGGTNLGWTLGQPASATYAGGGAVVTAGVQQPEGILLTLNISALLDGPYVPAASLMHDSLRTRGLLPVNEPFTALGHPPVGFAERKRAQCVRLAAHGPNAVVDWVFLELRGADDNGASTRREPRWCNAMATWWIWTAWRRDASPRSPATTTSPCCTATTCR